MPAAVIGKTAMLVLTFGSPVELEAPERFDTFLNSQSFIGCFVRSSSIKVSQGFILGFGKVS